VTRRLDPESQRSAARIASDNARLADVNDAAEAAAVAEAGSGSGGTGIATTGSIGSIPAASTGSD